jgi:hypothetical protein
MKRLTWFEDADLDSDLDVIDKNYSWEHAKEVILHAVENAI